MKISRENLHIRDPFVFVEDGRYYLVGTTGDDPWYAGSDLTLYASDDLEQFEEAGTLIADGSLRSYTNVWAPELHQWRGKYYLILSVFRDDLGRGSIVYVSDTLKGGFRPLTGRYVTPEGWWCLDATLSIYRDEPYLCFSNEWLLPVTNDGDGSLFIAKLRDDLTELAEKPKKIVSGKYCGFALKMKSGDAEGYIAEGPCLFEEDGKIVLLWSTVKDTGYSVLKSVSENGVTGDYRFEKVIFDRDGGHCMSFLDLNGKRRIALHQPNKTPLERMKLFEYLG